MHTHYLLDVMSVTNQLSTLKTVKSTISITSPSNGSMNAYFHYYPYFVRIQESGYAFLYSHRIRSGLGSRFKVRKPFSSSSARLLTMSRHWDYRRWGNTPGASSRDGAPSQRTGMPPLPMQVLASEVGQAKVPGPELELQGQKVPWWWPRDPYTHVPLVYVYRAMTIDLSELATKQGDLNKDHKLWWRQAMTQELWQERAMSILRAVCFGSRETSDYVHAAIRPVGARWFRTMGQDRRREDASMQYLCKINLLIMWKTGCLHQYSWADISCKKSWLHVIGGPDNVVGPDSDRLTHWYNRACADAVKASEIILAPRGCVPWEAYEVSPPS